jgi:hypothetical protein
MMERDHLKDLNVEGVDNIKINLQEMGWAYELYQGQDGDRWLVLVYALMNLKCWEFLDSWRIC